MNRIELNDNSGKYPDFKHLRYLFQDNKILVQHGHSELYGDKLLGLKMVSGNHLSLYFSREMKVLNFRFPKIGDQLRVHDGKKFAQSPIMNVHGDMLYVIIDLAIPLNIPLNARISFYDTNIYSSDKQNCVHSTFEEGRYLRFIPNDGKKKCNDRPYHEVIKIKDIKDIVKDRGV